MGVGRFHFGAARRHSFGLWPLAFGLWPLSFGLPQPCGDAFVAGEEFRKIQPGNDAIADPHPTVDDEVPDLARRAEEQAVDLGVRAGAGEIGGGKDGEVGAFAHFDRPKVPLPAEVAGTRDGGDFQGGADGHGSSPFDDPGQEQRLARLRQQVPRIVGGAAVDPQAHGDPVGAAPVDGANA